MTYLLDTNAVRALLDGEAGFVTRARTVPHHHLLLSSIAVEEMVGGRLAQIRKAQGGKVPNGIGQAHAYLMETLEIIKQFKVLTYTNEAEAVFKTLSARIKRVGLQDCRIAAQALRSSLIVVTRNIVDLTAAGVGCEDWSLI